MKSATKLATSTAFALVLTGTSAFAADIVVGTPGWGSADVTSHIIKQVLEDNLGIEVEVQTGTNPIIFEAMDKGTMHVHPEVWLPNQANLHNTYVKEKGSVVMNENGVESAQGMCVNESVAKENGVKSITDLTNPDVAKLLDTDGDGKGNIWVGSSSAASTPIEKIRAKSYGYDQTMNLMEMDDGAAFADRDARIAQGKLYAGFCWTPHPMFSQHDLVMLEEPAHDPEKWKIIQPTDDPEWLSKSSAPVGWSKAKFHVHFAKSVGDEYPQAASILANMGFTANDVAAMSEAVENNGKTPQDYAREWIAENSDRVNGWL